VFVLEWLHRPRAQVSIDQPEFDNGANTADSAAFGSSCNQASTTLVQPSDAGRFMITAEWIVRYAVTLAGAALIGRATDHWLRLICAGVAWRAASAIAFALVLLLPWVAAVAGPGVAAITLLPALGSVIWARLLGRKFGGSGRRYVTLVEYERLLQLWRASPASDTASQCRAILRRLDTLRDERTSELIDALVVVWSEVMIERTLSDQALDSATAAMNAAYMRLCQP
jgi:hypothetical protein